MLQCPPVLPSKSDTLEGLDFTKTDWLNGLNELKFEWHSLMRRPLFSFNWGFRDCLILKTFPLAVRRVVRICACFSRRCNSKVSYRMLPILFVRIVCWWCCDYFFFWTLCDMCTVLYYNWLASTHTQLSLSRYLHAFV